MNNATRMFNNRPTANRKYYVSEYLKNTLVKVEKDIVFNRNISRSFKDATDAICWLDMPSSMQKYIGGLVDER